MNKCQFNFLKFAKRYSSKSPNQVFDRGLKRRQRIWSMNIDDSEYYDYLRKESAERLVDRLDDITRSFPLAVELGSHRSHIFDLISDGIGGIETLIQCDNAPPPLLLNESKSNKSDLNPKVQSHRIICDEEYLPFKDESVDLVLSSMNMHWINDLPGTLNQIKTILKPDGVFIASMLGGNTLQELRYSFYLAESERTGGLSPHASPLALASDVASLMQAAGFSLPTIDVDTITISYPDAFTLMEHIRCMGEGNASLVRHYPIGKETMLAMAAAYQGIYGLEDGSIPATFQLIYMIGWKPDASQPKSCQRGSAKKSLKEIGN